MSYLDRLKAEKIGKTATEGTDKADKSPSVSFVGTPCRRFPEVDPTETSHRQSPDPAALARRQRVLAVLAANPMLRLAVVCDGEGDPVPVAVAIRGKGTCEVLIPAARFDPFALLELLERNSGTLH